MRTAMEVDQDFRGGEKEEMESVHREIANVYFGVSPPGSKSVLPDIDWLRRIAAQKNIKGMEVTFEHNDCVQTGEVEEMWVDETKGRLLAQLRFPIPKDKHSDQYTLTELIKQRVLDGVSPEWTTFRQKDEQAGPGKGKVLCQYLTKVTMTGLPKGKNAYVMGYPTAASLTEGAEGSKNNTSTQINPPKYMPAPTYADIVASIEADRIDDLLIPVPKKQKNMEQPATEAASAEITKMDVETPPVVSATNTVSADGTTVQKQNAEPQHARSHLQTMTEGLTSTHGLDPSNDATQAARDDAFKLTQADWQAVQKLNKHKSDQIERLSEANTQWMEADKKRIEEGEKLRKENEKLRSQIKAQKSQGNSKKVNYLKERKDTILSRYRSGAYKNDPAGYMEFENEMNAAIANPDDNENFVVHTYAASLTVDYAEQQQQAYRQEEKQKRMQEENIRQIQQMQMQIHAMNSGNTKPIFMPDLGNTNFSTPQQPQQQPQPQQPQPQQPAMNTQMYQLPRQQEQRLDLPVQVSPGVEQHPNMASLTHEQLQHTKSQMTRDVYFAQYNALYGFAPWGDDVEVVSTQGSMTSIMKDVKPFPRNVRTFQCALQIQRGNPAAGQKPWSDFASIVSETKMLWHDADSQALL